MNDKSFKITKGEVVWYALIEFMNYGIMYTDNILKKYGQSMTEEIYKEYKTWIESSSCRSHVFMTILSKYKDSHGRSRESSIVDNFSADPDIHKIIPDLANTPEDIAYIVKVLIISRTVQYVSQIDKAKNDFNI